MTFKRIPAQLHLVRAIVGWIYQNKKCITQNTQIKLKTEYYITTMFSLFFNHYYVILISLNSFKFIVKYRYYLKELYNITIRPIIYFLIS